MTEQEQKDFDYKWVDYFDSYFTGDNEEIKYNKAFAVAQYVNGLGLSISEMMKRVDHSSPDFNEIQTNNPISDEMIENIHQKAMEAIDSID
jgi:hypothetical protein